MALAVALGRVLILPRFVCFCDRHWLELDKCRMPGAELVGGGQGEMAGGVEGF